jgi:hypothetical protein
MKKTLAVAMLTVCAVQAGAQPADGKIVLKRNDGGIVSIPVVGPGRDPRAEQLARDIQALDAQILEATKRPSRLPGAAPTGAASQADPVKAEVVRLAAEARAEAVADLDLALTVARKTSAGSLDDETVARAKESAQSAATILNTQPPGSIVVATDISTSLPDARLHYMSNQKHRQQSKEWSSYTARERLRIGRYVFRVEPADSSVPVYEELVLVLSDPTHKRLTPLRSSDR